MKYDDVKYAGYVDCKDDVSALYVLVADLLTGVVRMIRNFERSADGCGKSLDVSDGFFTPPIRNMSFVTRRSAGSNR